MLQQSEVLDELMYLKNNNSSCKRTNPDLTEQSSSMKNQKDNLKEIVLELLEKLGGIATQISELHSFAEDSSDSKVILLFFEIFHFNQFVFGYLLY